MNLIGREFGPYSPIPSPSQTYRSLKQKKNLVLLTNRQRDREPPQPSLSRSHDLEKGDSQIVARAQAAV